MAEPSQNVTYLLEQINGKLVERLNINGQLYTMHDPLVDKLASNVDKQYAYLKGEIDKKQNTLTFDQTPTENSINPVTSGGVYSELALKTDDSSLDPIAKSGSFHDLKDFPTSYIDKDVKNLSYYYTMEQIDGRLGQINSFKYLILESLPSLSSADIDNYKFTIVLIHNSSQVTGQEGDYYLEYLLIDHNANNPMLDTPDYSWELIGTTDVSISGFVTNQQLIQTLTSYVSKQELVDQSYVTIGTLGNVLETSAYANVSYVTTELAKKQNNLQWDELPTQNSDNSVKSGGIYSAIQTSYNDLWDSVSQLSGDAVKNIDGTTPVGGRVNLSKSSIMHVSAVECVWIDSTPSSYQLQITTANTTVVTGAEQPTT